MNKGTVSLLKENDLETDFKSRSDTHLEGTLPIQ